MNNASQLDERNAKTSDCRRNCLKLWQGGSLHSRHRQTKDCRARSNKSSVLAMSAEMMTIRALRSSTVATGVSSTNDFRWSQETKSKGLRSSWGSLEVNQNVPVSNPALGMFNMQTVKQSNRKI
ncbi:hypothetical protein TNCV_4945401 [Trichonephila clavipes]|nr:hypothetical protein TNCV_4945401 [Trichonephila clavipes]